MRVGLLGGTGFFGTHIMEVLNSRDIPVVSASRRSGVDARLSQSVLDWFKCAHITHAINLAAECGGIGLNQQQPADLWLSSMQISTAVLEAARQYDLQKLTMVGTVCSYAAESPVPFRESDLMRHGFPEYTNAPYGVAKLSAYFGARAYRDQYGVKAIYLVPVNLYGPHDHFDPNSSHVIAALIRRFLEAKAVLAPEVVVWGTGKATREFLYARDAAACMVQATLMYDDPAPVNIGSGNQISIKDLAVLIAKLVGYSGNIIWDATKPDGQMRRCLDVSRARALIGWSATTSLKTGLANTIEWYKSYKKDNA